MWKKLSDLMAVPELPDRTVNRYNSIDSWEAISTVYQEHLLLDERKVPRWLKWIFVLFVPLSVAVISVTMRQTLQAIDRFQLRNVLEQLDKHYSDNHTLAVLTSVAATIGMTLVTLALAIAIARRFGDEATGRGLAAIVAHLNGVHLPQWGSWTNVIVKCVTTVLVVASNIPLGQYGMVAEIGAMFGAAVLKRNLLMLKIPFLTHFRNPRDRRLIVNIGLAAGVTAAFQSPIGGLLVVLELLTSKFPVKFAAYVFTGCVFCAFCVQVFSTYISGFEVRPRVDEPALRLDPTNEQRQVSLSYIMVVPATVIAVVCCLVGYVWTRITVMLARIHSQREVSFSTASMCVAAGVGYAAVNVLIAFAFGGDHCAPLSSSELDMRQSDLPETVSLGFTTSLFCTNRTNVDGSFKLATLYPVNSYASVALVFPESAFRLLIQREVTLDIGAMIVFAVVLFFGSSYFASLTRALNGDTLLPNAALGACIGHIVHRCQDSIGLGSPEWVNGGEYALLGAAAMLSAVNRLTFALVFLMVDVSGDVRHVAFVMLSVTVARVLAQNVFKFPSLEHSLLEAAAIPLLDFADNVATRDDLTLHRFQTPNLEVLRPDETVSHLTDLLRRTSHAAFPVVSKKTKNLLGVIHRNTIELLLWRYTRVPPPHLCCDVSELLGQLATENHDALPSARWRPGMLEQRMPGISLLTDEDRQQNALARSAIGPASPADMKRQMDDMTQQDLYNDQTVEMPSPLGATATGFDEYVQMQELDDWVVARKQSGFYTPANTKLNLPFPTLLEAIDADDPKILRLRVNLLRYADKSPFTVRLATSAGRAYHMFNVLGARHLVIVDYAGRPRGILTRIDLLRHVFEEKRLQEQLEAEQDDQVPSDSDENPSPVAADIAAPRPFPMDADSPIEADGSFVKVYPEASKRFGDRAPAHRAKLKKTASLAADLDDEDAQNFVYVSHRRAQWSGNAFSSQRQGPKSNTTPSEQSAATRLLMSADPTTTLRRALFLPRGTVPVPLDPHASIKGDGKKKPVNLSFARPANLTPTRPRAMTTTDGNSTVAGGISKRSLGAGGGGGVVSWRSMEDFDTPVSPSSQPALSNRQNGHAHSSTSAEPVSARLATSVPTSPPPQQPLRSVPPAAVTVTVPPPPDRPATPSDPPSDPPPPPRPMTPPPQVAGQPRADHDVL